MRSIESAGHRHSPSYTGRVELDGHWARDATAREERGRNMRQPAHHKAHVHTLYPYYIQVPSMLIPTPLPTERSAWRMTMQVVLMELAH